MEISVSDAGDQPVQLSWAVQSGPNNGDLQLVPSSPLYPAQESGTVVGEYVITIAATDGIASSQRSIRILITDSAPTILGLRIEPDTLTIDTAASAEFDNWFHGQDYYSDLRYYWRINNNSPIRQQRAKGTADIRL